MHFRNSYHFKDNTNTIVLIDTFYLHDYNDFYKKCFRYG